MERKLVSKLISVLLMVILAMLILVHVNSRHIDTEFLCAENGHNLSGDTSVAIIGEWGYYTNGHSLVRWNVDSGVVDNIENGFWGQLLAYKDELYYYDGDAIIVWNPFTNSHKLLYQMPDGESLFSYFPYHDMIFCLFLDHMTVLDTHSGEVLFTWNNLSVSNTTYAIMNDELYFLVSNPPQNSSLFKYDMAHQCMELLESGLILNLYNTGETLIYQRYQEDWHNGTWQSYQQGKEIMLEIDPGLIIGTTPNGIVFTNDNYTDFSYWNGKQTFDLDVPIENIENPRLAAYICTGEYLVIIEQAPQNTDYVFSTALTNCSA